MDNPIRIRLDWSELDLFDHINNVHYFKFIQAARVRLWEQIGLYQDYKKTNIGPILANASCNFLKPLYYPGFVTIETKVTFIKNSSFGFSHTFYNDDNQRVAEASDVMVYYNFNLNENTPIPNWLREQLIPHLIGQ